MLKRMFAAVALGLGLSVCTALGGPNTSLPFTADFSDYPLGPIEEGTNGWYPSSTNIVVQDAVVNKATKAAAIPVDCILSNRFTGITDTNVWIHLDIRPSLYDGTNFPAVDTNSAIMFYINSNGNFVVRDGPEDTGSWVTCEDFDINTNGTEWIRITIKEDFTQHTWALYGSNSASTSLELITNDIDFITNS